MTRRRALWGLLSLALAFGINLQLRPSFARTYDRSEYEKATGLLQLRGSGGGSIPLANVHVVTTDFTHVGKRYDVRQLVLRAADDVLSTPRMELFAALPIARGQDLAESAHNPELLQGLELPVEPFGWLGKRPSYLVLEGGRQVAVTGGRVRFDTIAPIEGDAGGVLAKGQLYVWLDTDNGPQKVSGAVSARLVWDAD